MPKKKAIKVGVIRPGDVKVRKKSPPPTRVQKSPKDYDRKRINAIESVAQAKFAVLRDHLNHRLSDDSDPMQDYEVAKNNLPAHAITRAILSDEIVEPEVVIAAYMFDDDPDCRIEDQHEKRAGIEDPYEGVIRYYGLHDKGDIPKEIARRTKLLYTDIQSSLRLSFSVSM